MMVVEGTQSNQNSAYLLLLIIPIILSVFLRLYPYLLYQAPWGTDGWPLFHNTISLLSYSPTKLGGNPAFDNYNIYWPGVSIFGAVTTLLIGASPLSQMPIFVPFIGALTTFMLFVLVMKLTGNIYIAFASSMIFASASFDSIFTASVTKETFAYPIFTAALIPLVRRFDRKTVLVFTILSFGVLLSHYALAFLLFLIAFVPPLAGGFLGLFDGKESLKRFILPFVLGVMGLTYYVIYAYPSILIVTISETQALSMAAYLILSTGLLAYVLTTKHARSLDIAFILLVALILGISTRYVFAPFAPTLNMGLLVFALPYALIALLATVGFRNLTWSTRSLFTLGWLSIPLGIGGFSLFGTPEGVGIIYRLLTFAYAPAAMLASVAMFGGWYRMKGWKKAAVVILILAVAAGSSYQNYDAVVNHSNLLGGQWAYYPSDLSSAFWYLDHMGTNGSVAGDARISYLYSGFYGINVTSLAGYEYLVGESSELTTPLVTYSLMAVDGYDLNNFGQKLPTDWQRNLSNNLSSVYSNGNDMIWYG
jgi:hypothetical protein